MEIPKIYRVLGDIQTVVEAKAPMGMRWGIIGTEALSPRLREAETTAETAGMNVKWKQTAGNLDIYRISYKLMLKDVLKLIQMLDIGFAYVRI